MMQIPYNFIYIVTYLTRTWHLTQTMWFMPDEENKLSEHVMWPHKHSQYIFAETKRH